MFSGNYGITLPNIQYISKCGLLAIHYYFRARYFRSTSVVKLTAFPFLIIEAWFVEKYSKKFCISLWVCFRKRSPQICPGSFFPTKLFKLLKWKLWSLKYCWTSLYCVALYYINNPITFIIISNFNILYVKFIWTCSRKLF